MVSWLIKASILAACLFLANKAAAEESSVVDAESERALVKFAKYLADPDVPENKKVSITQLQNKFNSFISRWYLFVRGFNQQ